MDLFVYSDESGVFDNIHNRYFVFGGLVFCSYKERDEAIAMYKKAESCVKVSEGMLDEMEAKACYISNKSKGKLFRSLNRFHRFGVIIDQKRINENIWSNKKTKQRYLDYAYKIAIKRMFLKMIRLGEIKPEEIGRVRIYSDEHATATDGKYELREGLEQEFKYGTFNYTWNKFHPPIFPSLNSVELSFCDSKSVPLIRAADIVANKIYHSAEVDEFNYLKGKTFVSCLP